MHQRGCSHNDIRGNNAMLGKKDRRGKLMDFGQTFRYSKKNFGSLLLTMDYSNQKAEHPLLDKLYKLMSELVDLSDNKVHLNETLYIIPKYPIYTTNHHQDIHVEPHIVIYQHVQK